MEKGFTHPSDYPLSARRDIERLQDEIERLKARLEKYEPPAPETPEIPDEIYFDVDWEDGWEDQDEQTENTTP